MEMNKNIEKWYELHTDEVNALSDDIWAHPEVGMQEHYAAKATAAVSYTHLSPISPKSGFTLGGLWLTASTVGPFLRGKPTGEV